MEKIGIFPGSFNPFTIGHKAIVEEAFKVFDKIIIVFSVNSKKRETDVDDLEKRMNDVRDVFKGRNVDVIHSDKMTVDVAREYGAMIIRGLRDGKDFEYEKRISNVNRMIGGVSTVFFLLGPEYDTVSSSLVRELRAFGKDAEADRLVARPDSI